MTGKEVNGLSKEAEEQYLMEEGILSKPNTISEYKIGDYIEHNEKMSQLKRHKEKVEFAKQKQTESYYDF